jgi:hypothetical protein
MRLVPVRTAVYLALFALPAVAQPPTLISSEMPHVELSVGLGGMTAGSGIDLERRMTDLGLVSRASTLTYPRTTPMPGLFAQVQVGVAEHAMVGVWIGADETKTEGRSHAGTYARVVANVHTRALLFSYRPNPWLKLGAGPAVMRRLVAFDDGQTFHGKALGWVTAAEAKFARKPMTPEHPPGFGYVTAQYRATPGVSLPQTTLPVYSSGRATLPWPAERVRMSHWMFGVGVGFEI